MRLKSTNPARAGLVSLASALVAVAAGPFFGWMSGRVERKPTVVVLSAAIAGSSLLYLLAPNAAGFTAGKLLDDGGRAGRRGPAAASVRAVPEPTWARRPGTGVR